MTTFGHRVECYICKVNFDQDDVLQRFEILLVQPVKDLYGWFVGWRERGVNKIFPNLRF